MKQMGIFYNKNFDTLMVILNNDTKEAIVRNELHTRSLGHDITEINYLGTVLGYNLAKISDHFSDAKLQSGINSDCPAVIDFVKTSLATVRVDLSDYNLTPQFMVGKVISKENHEKSNKLSICQVDFGNEIKQIVCGAPNVAAGQLVVGAQLGAIMPNALKILPSELMGVASNGMLCSARELGLPSDVVKGIMELDMSKYQVGQSFWGAYYGW